MGVCACLADLIVCQLAAWLFCAPPMCALQLPAAASRHTHVPLGAASSHSARSGRGAAATCWRRAPPASRKPAAAAGGFAGCMLLAGRMPRRRPPHWKRSRVGAAPRVLRRPWVSSGDRQEVRTCCINKHPHCLQPQHCSAARAGPYLPGTELAASTQPSCRICPAALRLGSRSHC